MKKKYLIKTKYGVFQVLIWFDTRDKVYIAQVPSFSQAMTQGSSISEAKRMAEDIIELLSEAAFDDGKAVIDDERSLYAKGKLARHSGPVTVVT